MKLRIGIFLRGLAMGAADIVPGVSGGTIAFITGIYEEFINSIKGLNPKNLLEIKKGFAPFWKAINGNFLLPLGLGIISSILLLSGVIKHLLATSPVLVWSFFFGLIIASIILLIKDIEKINPVSIFSMVLASFFAYYLTIIEPSSAKDGHFYLFFSGFLAIIAMILPGISGAFILLLLGSYEVVLEQINLLKEGLSEMNIEILTIAITKIGLFMIGAVLGLLCFSRILSWLFKNYKNVVISILIGFMIGSLNKVWPWKNTLTTRINSHGEEVPLFQTSVLPSSYEGQSQILMAFVLAIVGILMILLLDKFSKNSSEG